MKLIIVEDNKSVSRLLEIYLRAMTFEELYSFVVCGTIAAAIREHQKEPADIVLLDLCLPDSMPADTVSRIEEFYGAAVVVITGNNDVSLQVHAFQFGADSWISKQKLMEDPQRLRDCVWNALMRRQFKPLYARTH